MAFHYTRNLGGAAFVVDGGVELGSGPGNGVVGVDLGKDGAAELARGEEEGAPTLAFAFGPGAVEKGLAVEIAVEFFGEFDADVVGEELADIGALGGHLKKNFVGLKNSCNFALTILRIRRPSPKVYTSAFYLYNSLIREPVFTHTSSICLPVFCLFFILLRICQSARWGSSMMILEDCSNP